MSINIPLDEEDFKCLVRGGVITISYHAKGFFPKIIKICLKDIGYDHMAHAISMADENLYKPHNKIME